LRPNGTISAFLQRTGGTLQYSQRCSEHSTACGDSFRRVLTGVLEGYSQGYSRCTLKGSPRLRSGVLQRYSVGPGELRVRGVLRVLTRGTPSTHRGNSEYSHGVLRVLTRRYSKYSHGVLRVLTRGTRSTHRGYSEHSQGVLRVLTHLGLPVGCACGGVPITCRETRAPPPGVPSCKPRWVSTQSTPVSTRSTP
jgi:hypothetical protein